MEKITKKKLAAIIAVDIIYKPVANSNKRTNWNIPKVGWHNKSNL